MYFSGIYYLINVLYFKHEGIHEHYFTSGRSTPEPQAGGGGATRDARAGQPGGTLGIKPHVETLHTLSGVGRASHILDDRGVVRRDSRRLGLQLQLW